MSEPKKTYTIHVHYSMIHEMEVEAENEEEAIEIAEENFGDEDCSSDSFDDIIDSCVVA